MCMFVAELHNYGATPATKVSIAMNAVFTSTPPTFMVDETKLTSHYVVRDIPEQSIMWNLITSVCQLQTGISKTLRINMS